MPALSSNDTITGGIQLNSGKAIVLHGILDAITEQAVRRTWHQAEALGLEIERAPDEVRPHMTLGSWRVGDLPGGTLERLALKLASLPAVSCKLYLRLVPREQASFALVPLVQIELLAWHKEIHALAGSLGQPLRPGDFPGTWAPRVSLFSCNEDDFANAYQIVRSLNLPLNAKIGSLAFVTYGANEPLRVALTFDVRKA
jgi:hypothetical protein